MPDRRLKPDRNANHTGRNKGKGGNEELPYRRAAEGDRRGKGEIPNRANGMRIRSRVNRRMGCLTGGDKMERGMKDVFDGAVRVRLL
ncbi:hypothetical protein BH24BAC1_BH24BAC1_32010 [soil metagenome]